MGFAQIKKGEKEMKHYLFTDRATCEDFIIDDDSLYNAYETARENFAEPDFICELTDWQAKTHWAKHL